MKYNANIFLIFSCLFIYSFNVTILFITPLLKIVCLRSHLSLMQSLKLRNDMVYTLHFWFDC